MTKTILTSQYLAPIAYYQALLNSDMVLIEQYNHYEKKTYQNRCEILAANGKIALSVPVEKTKNPKTPFKDIKIAYHTNWQKQHLKAIISAYQNSPFCEFYIDDFRPFYEKKTKFLLDFNMGLQNTVLEAIDEPVDCVLTDEFYQGAKYADKRFSIHPKTNIDQQKSYIQVFSDKLGFHPNLSILDLLFNLGPETESFLKENL